VQKAGGREVLKMKMPPPPYKIGVPNCGLSGKPLLEKREKWRTPSYLESRFKDKPALYSPR
jgi:hypothetical protein